MAESSIPADIRKMSFEQALEELKQIVERLEQGQGELDQAIEAYQRGALLKQHCEAKLRDAVGDERLPVGPEQQWILEVALLPGAPIGTMDGEVTGSASFKPSTP